MLARCVLNVDHTLPRRTPKALAVTFFDGLKGGLTLSPPSFALWQLFAEWRYDHRAHRQSSDAAKPITDVMGRTLLLAAWKLLKVSAACTDRPVCIMEMARRLWELSERQCGL